MKTNFPQEYIDGEVEFFYARFFVNEHVLIPRIETESLVRYGKDLVKKYSIETLIDVGTGSGIIPISIARISGTSQNIAIDISPKALEVAKKNATRHNISVDFYESDLLDIFFQEEKKTLEKNILITANLPYIGEDEETGEWVEYEPYEALYGWGENGLDIYIRFFQEIKKFSQIYSTSVIRVLCETGHNQREDLVMLFEKLEFSYEFLLDLRHIDRFVLITFTWNSRSPV